MSALLAALGGRRRTIEPGGPPYNAANPLTIPTPYPSQNALHPDVVDFHPASWNGFRFWMAFTPLPEPEENPCIVASNDGVTWVAPSGLSNPIDPTPPTGYNSDTALAYDAGSLHCFWRERPANLDEIIWRSSSMDGITWSTPTEVFHSVGTGGAHLSPTLVRYGEGWRAYLKRGDGDGAAEFFTLSSIDAAWGTPTTFTLPGAKNPNHFAIAKAGGHYYLAGHTSYDGNTIKAWHSTDLSTWTEGPDLIFTAPGKWDGGKLYRCALAPHEDGQTMRVWYSALSSSNWRIGYARIPLSAWTA